MFFSSKYRKFKLKLYLYWVWHPCTCLSLSLSIPSSLSLSLFLPFARSSTCSQWKRVIQGLVLQKAVLKLEAKQNKQIQQIYALKLTHADETDWKHSESRRWFGNLQWSIHPHLWLTERLRVQSNKCKINLISTNINKVSWHWLIFWTFT